MKRLLPGRVLMIVIFNVFFFSEYCNAQFCENGKKALSMSYSTIVKGGGNDVYNLSFPKFDTSYIFKIPPFDPSKGTLIQVNVKTVKTVKYSYTLENLAAIEIPYKIKMIRSDVMFSPAIVDSIEDLKNITIATPTLAPSDENINSGPDFTSGGPAFAFNKMSITHPITDNIAGFMGKDSVAIQYKTETDFYPSGSDYSWKPSIEDSISFEITYFYCITNALPAGISNFSASRLASGSIQLNWFIPNDVFGNIYQVEKSGDGKNFTSVSSVVSKSNSLSSYSLVYSPAEADKNRIFFHIKVTDKSGAVKYSDIRYVNLPVSAGMMKVFPTLTTDVLNINFAANNKADYLVNIRSVTGQIIQQYNFYQTNTLKLAFSKKLPAGFYVVEAINKATRESRLSKFIVQ